MFHLKNATPFNKTLKIIALVSLLLLLLFCDESCKSE